MNVTQKMIDWLRENDPSCPRVAKDANETTKQLTFGKRIASLLFEGELSAEKLSELQSESEDDMTATASEVFSGRKASNETRVRVKGADESYSTKRATGLHTKTGREVPNPFTGRPAEYNSELDNARSGVLLKHLAARSGLFSSVNLPEHEKALLHDMAENEPWAGNLDGEYQEKIVGGSRVKALLDDVASGGVEITPVFFDDQIVTFPLLTGELLPRVDLRPVPRGRRVESGSVGTPTISWGQGDDVQVPLFNTAALVDGIDTTIFGAAVAIEVGRDFLSDQAVNVGDVLTRLIGERMQQELDRCIAVGNGATQPAGIVGAAGNVINADNGAGGPPTLDDYVSLLFAIGKQYRNQAMRPAFLSNDTSFQRSRSIAIDTNAPTTDQRPALAPLTEINRYSTLGWDHAIQNDVTNPVCVFGAMSKYRLYRRQGMEVRWVDGGITLARENKVLLVARARYGGRVMDANAFATWADGQA